MVTNHYLPGFKAGGPVKSIAALHDNLRASFDLCVMTSDRDHGDSTAYSEIQRDKINSYGDYNILYLSQLGFLNVILNLKKANPRIIYLNSFFSKLTRIILIMKYVRLINSPIVLAPRGELSKGALSIGRFKKQIFLFFSKILRLHSSVTFHATDEIEARDIQKHYLINQIVTIPNLTAKYSPSLNSIIYKKPGELRIVFVSRISKKKNLLFALEMLGQIHKGGIIFDIYGPIEDNKYWEACCEEILKLNKSVFVTYKGTLRPSDVYSTLSKYHVFLMPTLDENFGHVIVEAMQCGCIPIISDQTPWRNLEKQGVGWSINLDEKAAYIAAINEVVIYNNQMFFEKSKRVKEYIETKIDNEGLVIEYKKMFNQLMVG